MASNHSSFARIIIKNPTTNEWRCVHHNLDGMHSVLYMGNNSEQLFEISNKQVGKLFWNISKALETLIMI
jgi:hypothetical protein